MNEGETEADLMKRVGLANDDEEMHGNLRQWSARWGRSQSSGISEIHDKIEHISQL